MTRSYHFQGVVCKSQSTSAQRFMHPIFLPTAGRAAPNDFCRGALTPRLPH